MSDLDANFDNQLAAFMGGEKGEEVKEPETVASVSEEETIQEPVKPADQQHTDGSGGSLYFSGRLNLLFMAQTATNAD